MAARLTRGSFAATVVVVLLLHAAATQGLAAMMRDVESEAAMPKRIEIAYVRTLESAPAPAAVAAPPPPAAVTTPRAAREPRPAALPASAPGDAAAVAAAAASAEPASAAVALADAAPSTDAAAITQAAAASAPADAAGGAPSTIAVAAAATSPPSVAAAAASASTAAGVPFAWPAATRVTYALSGNYRGEVQGHAEVEWIRQGDRYQVNVDLVVGPGFAPILERRATSEGRLTDQGLAPDRYDERSRFMFRDARHFAIVFWPDSVVLANGQRRERASGTQDSASQFIQFSWLFGVRPELLKVGNTFDVPLALPRSMDRWSYDVQQEEPLATPFGTLATFHLRPRRSSAERKRNNEVAVEMWLAPELRFLPVRIRFEQDPQTWIDLVIARRPELSG